jgi:hypothetical protein
MRAWRIAVMLIIVIGTCSLLYAANRVEILSSSVPAGNCYSGEIRIAIENDVDLHSISIPLVVRSVSGPPGFWISAKLRPSSGRLASALDGIQSLETGQADFTSPDHVWLYFEAMDSSDCLPAGPSEVMTGLIISGDWFGGVLEIDTALYPPCGTPRFTACADQQPIVWDEFVPGYISLSTPPSSYCDNVTTHIDSTSLLRWSGTTVVNDADYTNAVGEPLRFRLVSGPGVVDNLTGNWQWKSSPSESGIFDVSIAVYPASCSSLQCMPVTFDVELRQPVPGDLNCDGFVDIVDVVIEVGQSFRGEPAPVPCWNR